MIKEHPMLMSAPMVRVTLDNSKTQTRRLNGLDRFNVKPDAWRLRSIEFCGTHSNPFVTNNRKKGEVSLVVFEDDSGVACAACPYGKPGDRLWVRETFAQVSGDCRDESEGEGDAFIYRADCSESVLKGCWKPSIHMPRFASRIVLEIVDIRVERLQDISAEDCRAEGVPSENNDMGVRYSFGVLWEQINGADSWTKNPWVWVVEFKRVEEEK